MPFNENEIIRRFSRGALKDFSVLKGIGDDAAVLRADKRSVVITTDHLCEGVHFERRWAPPELLAKKLFLTNLSDISSMGASARWALLNIALPRNLPIKWLTEFEGGFRKILREHSISLIGGDTTASARDIFLSLTLAGTATEKNVLTRRGARAGDFVFVSGTLGGSAAGLKILKSHGSFKKTPPRLKKLALRHLAPPARAELGLALSRKRLATAAIDISDGLAIDLTRLCGESAVGAVVWQNTLPADPDIKKIFPKEIFSLALYGGEDYELLFAVSPKKVKAVRSVSKALKIKLTLIGKITETKNICLSDTKNAYSQKILSLKNGYAHF